MDFDEYDYLEKTVQENDDRDSKKKAVKKEEKSYRKREVDDDVSGDEERKSSKRSRGGDHENGRDKDKDKDRDRHHRSSGGGRERDRDGERDRDRDRGGEREKERDRERSSRDKEKERERRDREKEKERERERRERREKDEKERSRRSVSRSDREEKERSRRSVSRSEREEKERSRRSVSRSEREEKERSRRSRSHTDRDREREVREKEREFAMNESRRFKDKKEMAEPEADPERDQRTVFAYQMPLKATERDVYEFFSKAGKVRDVRLIMDRNSRRSKGVGYIEFYDAMHVPMAIALSGQLLLGQPVMVKPSEAEKNLVQSTASGGTTGIVGPYGAVDRKLYVGNLHFNMTETHLREIFEPFGPVELVQLPLDIETSQCKGFGFVQFAHLEHAKAAQSLNGKLDIAGRTIKVSSVTDHVGSQEAGAKSADFDDDDGGGLSLNAQSRALLMQKLDRTGAATSIAGSLGVPVLNGSATNQRAVNLPMNGQTTLSAPFLPARVMPTAEPIGNPSECLLLKDMFDPATETEPDFDVDIKDDVEEECSKYGCVKHIYVEKNSAGFVYLRFETVEAAAAAQRAMHLRWFAGRQISALFMDAQKSDSGSSDSLDSLFGDKDSSSVLEVSSIIQPKEEPDGLEDEKKASLLMMNFSRDEVEFAMNRLGADATINDLVDFIIASQISVKLENDVGTVHGDEEKEDTSDEKLYGIMEKSVRLLEMGFSENQVSVAIEKFGSGAPLTDLAESIVTGKIYDDCYEEKIKCSTSHSDHSRNVSGFLGTASYGSVKVENEDFYPDTASGSRDRDLAENYLGKRPKQEIIDDSNSVPQFRVSRPIDFGENRKGKRPKREYVDHSSFSAWMEEKVDPEICKVGNLKLKSGNKMAGKAPYFLYGNVLNLPYDSWSKVSQFLYDHQPEYANSQFFSALNRKEGYVHNLPTENRFRIPEEPPMTIQDVIPYAKNLWPPWDTRKQLTCISSETSGISQLCDRLGRTVSDCGGMLSPEKQREILHHCNLLNLVWVGRNKLGPLQPEYLEQILGYPLNHTKVGESGLIERLISLKYSFQTDTLAYHLSVLKHLYPAGITMFSIFSGIGGAEIALHKLGIPLKGVVSVETCATKRRILRRWWETTGQIGQLEQIDDIHKLTSSKLESLMKRFGGFDFLICQNPCSSSVSKVPAQSGGDPGFDFSLFYEFVRVYQRVKNMMDRKS